MQEFLDPLGDGISRISLLNSMGNDLSIVNDAKASFDRVASEMGEKEERLLSFLIHSTPPHTSPFRGVVFKFKIKAPLFICRQWFKHLVASNHNDEQLQWNEKSFRYSTITEDDEFYIPLEFRAQHQANKQASIEGLNNSQQERANKIYTDECKRSYEAYSELLKIGVARDQARGVLIPAVYTSWTWTASLQAVIHFIELRKGNGAQYEITSYASAIRELIQPIVPLTLKHWDA